MMLEVNEVEKQNLVLVIKIASDIGRRRYKADIFEFEELCFELLRDIAKADSVLLVNEKKHLTWLDG